MFEAIRVRVRPRALLIAVIVLVVLDVALRTQPVRWFPVDFRMPDRTTLGLEQLVGTAASSRGVRIAVVGDSVEWGGFSDRPHTFPAQLTAAYRASGRAVTAYNYGLNGAHADTLYALTGLVTSRHAADVILYDFDYHFAGASTADPGRYPRLAELAAPALRANGDPELTALALPAAKAKTFAQRAGDAVGAAWELYAEREYLKAVVFGDTPAAPFSRELAAFERRAAGQAPFAKRALSKLPLADLRASYGFGRLTESSLQIRYLTAALRIARKAGVPIVVYAGPIDRATLTAAGVFDPVAYAANVALVEGIVTREGGTFLDLSDTVPSAQMGDTHHPLGPGYARMVSAVVPRIEGAVKTAEAARGVSGGRR